MDALPPEILHDIFLKTLPCVYSEYHIPCSESIASPLRVSHVCRSWREIALSFRGLWSYLYISHRELFRRRKHKMMVGIFDTWLARTNGGPINFMIDIDPPLRAITKDHERAEYILTTLFENQHRWKDVYFRCYAVKFSPRFPGFNLTNMPLLTSLNLNLGWLPLPVVNLTRSSRLRRLKLGQVNFDLVAGGQLPHLEQVVILLSSLKQIGTSQRNRIDLSCLDLLRNAPSLHRVQINTQTIGPLSPFPLDGGRILLTGLRDLNLWEGFDSHLPATVVDNVTLPSLERLTYFGTAIGGEELFRFVQRSAPPLTHLCLGWEDAHEESLINILRLCPDLRHLTLLHVKLSCRFFHELTIPDATNCYTSAAGQIVCPSLSFFKLYCFPPTNRSTWLDRLFTMVKSRAYILGTFETATYYKTFYRTVDIEEIDDYADDIALSGGITFNSLQDLDDA